MTDEERGAYQLFLHVRIKVIEEIIEEKYEISHTELRERARKHIETYITNEETKKAVLYYL